MSYNSPYTSPSGAGRPDGYEFLCGVSQDGFTPSLKAIAVYSPHYVVGTSRRDVGAHNGRREPHAGRARKDDQPTLLQRL